MKKIFLSFVLILTFVYIFVYVYKNDTYKVFLINTPVDIFIDFNKNLIFDEKNSVKHSKFVYLENYNLIKKYPLLSSLSEEEVFFAKYKANEYANKFLKNKYVKYSDGEFYIENKSYSQFMLDSHFVFDSTEKSQKLFLDNLKSYNLDEYYIYNTRTSTYHKLNCDVAKKTLNYKIIHFSALNKKMKPCSLCVLKKQQIMTPFLKKTNKYFSDSFQNGNLKVYFNDLNKIFIPSKECRTNSCIALKKEIDDSKTSIDFAIYGINDQPEIFNALINAKKRGVKIRWVCDYDKKNFNYYKDTLSLMKYIPSYRTDESYDNSNSSAIMHNKFFIFDKKKVWTGSSNITSTDLTSFNANFSILVNSEELARIYTDEFNQMYNGSFHKNKTKFPNKIITFDNNVKIKPLFSPQDNIIENEIIPLINNSKKYIYIPIFFFTSKDIADALISAHKSGVEIKIINDATNSHTKYTVHQYLRDAGIKVKTENYAGKMHIKSMIIDDSVSVIGSMNFTKSANLKNDENVLIIYDSKTAKFLKNTFIYLWNKIPNKYLNYDPKAESTESVGSCFDGIDNDFDSKIDKEDEGCFTK